MRLLTMFLTLLASLLLPMTGVTGTIPEVTFQRHEITLTVDVMAQRGLVNDRGTLATDTGWNLFYLAEGAIIDSLVVEGKRTEFLAAAWDDDSGLPETLRDRIPPEEDRGRVTRVLFRSDRAGAGAFYLSFSVVFEDKVDGVQFSREAIGREVAGTILERGAYLSPTSCFYPQGNEAMATFRLTADIPQGWESVSDGNSVSSETRNGRVIQTWENPFASDGCFLMAAPFVKFTTMVNDIEVRCLFFPEDSSLAPKYLAATADYIRMYAELIGPYPFTQFTVAENFFPTGYGMPGWTLLGQSVLKLPFIIGTSLGHEVLHNWWGNSVYVDYERGNWCEGLTSYGADYRYKLNESAVAAREYRKDVLKQYASYVKGDKDFPLSAFTSRTSPNTRAVGYGKAMMVFHMIEEEIGSGPFFDAWKTVYRDYKGKQVSWEDWIGAFERASGESLSAVMPQWVDRPGAPMLKLDSILAGPARADGHLMRISMSQDGNQLYDLRVPMRAEGPGGSTDTVYHLNAERGTCEWLVPAGTIAIVLDPDYHLFRRLHPEEIEPIISGVLGTKEKSFVVNTADAQARMAFTSFAGSFVEDSARLVSSADLQEPQGDKAPIVFNPADLPDYLSSRVVVRADSVVVEGASYARANHTFVLAAQGWRGFAKCMIVLSDDLESLPRLGQLVPHYGKYSYLVFEGAKNVAKGQWQVGDSPLRRLLAR